MIYKDEIVDSMKFLAEQSDTLFIGNGLLNGDRIYGTLDKVPTQKCIEMPVAENLIAGVAIGLSLRKYRPVVIFQRMDFMLIAADAIINHLALMPKMSGGQFELPLIIRCIVGSQSTKFDVGEQHRKDFSSLFEPYIQVVSLKDASLVLESYKEAYSRTTPTMFVEYKDSYAETTVEVEKV